MLEVVSRRGLLALVGAVAALVVAPASAAPVRQGHHARLDPFRVDLGIVPFAEVTLKGHGSEDLARFDAAIAKLPQVVEASHVSGAYDYLLKVVVADWPNGRGLASN